MDIYSLSSTTNIKKLKIWLLNKFKNSENQTLIALLKKKGEHKR